MLKLVDLVLVANLVLIMIGAAVEIFVPKAAALDRARAELPGVVDFTALKLKVFGSISAIAAIEMLETFVNIHVVDKQDVLWEILILLVLVVAGVLTAWMDRICEARH